MDENQRASLIAYIRANVPFNFQLYYWILRVGADKPQRFMSIRGKKRKISETIVRHPSDPDRFNLEERQQGQNKDKEPIIKELIMWPDLIELVLFQWIERRGNHTEYYSVANRSKFKTEMKHRFVVHEIDVIAIIKCFEEFVKQQNITLVHPFPFTRAPRTGLPIAPSPSASAAIKSSPEPTSSSPSLTARSPQISGPSAVITANLVTSQHSSAFPFSKERSIDQPKLISNQHASSSHDASQTVIASAIDHQQIQHMTAVIARYETNGKFMNMLLQTHNILGPSHSSYNGDSFKFPPLAETVAPATTLMSNSTTPLILANQYARPYVAPATATLPEYLDQLIRIARLRRTEHSTVMGMHRDLVEHLPHVLLSLETIQRDGHAGRLLELADLVIDNVSLISANKLIAVLLFANIIRMIKDVETHRYMWDKIYKFLSANGMQCMSQWDAVQLVGLGMFLAETDADLSEGTPMAAVPSEKKVQQFWRMVEAMRRRKASSVMHTMLWPVVQTFIDGSKHTLHVVDGGDEMVIVTFPTSDRNSDKSYIWTKINNTIEMSVEELEMQAGNEAGRGLLHIWTQGVGVRKWWKVADDVGMEWFCTHHNSKMADAILRRDALARMFRSDVG
jgi:hypothetical protein